MTDIAIITSTQDPASMNIRAHLLEKGFEETQHTYAGYPVFSRGNCRLYTTDENSIYCEHIDSEIEASLFIFATKHESSAGRPALSCHAPGNWGPAEFGGRDGDVCIAPGAYLREAYLYLKRTAQDLDHEVSVEQTHHGPYIEKPIMFIEIGSDRDAWTEPRYGDIISGAIIHLLDNEPEKKSAAMVFGGGHYNIPANKVMDRTGYAVGHICAKFLLEHLTEEKIRTAIERHTEPVDCVILDWKGMGPHKQDVVGMLDKMQIPYKRLKDLA